MQTSSRDEILQSLAYACWVKRGRPLGSPEIDWNEAEQMYAASESEDSADDVTVVSSALDRTTLVDADSTPNANTKVDSARLNSENIPTLTQRARAL